MQTRCCSRMCICAADGFDPANQFPNYLVGLHSAWSPTSRRPEKRTPCTGTANRGKVGIHTRVHRLLVIIVATAITAGAASTALASSLTRGPKTPKKVSNQVALDYTGGQAGKADPKLSPVTIGLVNGEGGPVSFPDNTAGVKAAVKYVNAELGGVQKHPVKVVTCFIATAEDGQKCGTEMVNNDAVQVVIFGASVVGNSEFYGVVAGKKPVLVDVGLTDADLTTRAASTFSAGIIGTAKGAMWIIANQLKAQKVAALFEDSAPGRNAFNLLVKPVLQNFGITDVTGVPVPATAAGPEVQQALLNAGADKADALAILSADAVCIAAFDAYRALGLKIPVVTPPTCAGKPMTQHLEDAGVKGVAPDGWYYVWPHNNPYVPLKSMGTDVYLNKMAKYGAKDADISGGFAQLGFANLLTIVKFANEIGADGLTAEAFTQKIAAFAGPMMP